MNPNDGCGNPFMGTYDERKALVRVKLRNGRLCGPWAAHTTRWSITGHDFDVLEWEKV